MGDGAIQHIEVPSIHLCSEFCIAGEGVFQKDFAWYVRVFTGAINGKNVYKTENFCSGFVFA